MDKSERFEIEFPQELAMFVHARVGSEAPSQDKVAAYVRDLVRRDQEQAQGYKDTIRQQIADGMASLRAGRTIDGESRMAQRTARLEELERQGR
jgi:polyhydroxyalkanoate synthesis regulator phasin